MTTKMSLDEFEKKLAADLDTLALDLLPEGSFARWVYEQKSYPVVHDAHTPAEANRGECKKWGLSAEEWAEQMAVARAAMAHDMKLDLIKEGYF
ncbi:MAG TPA: hypothetical protein VLA52_15220 [Thermohalobaculum sp.]|nr:hypothetical protein [Thermohalobaculum sp.]